MEETILSEKIPSLFSTIEKLRILLNRKQKLTWLGIIFFAIVSSILEVFTTTLVVVFAQILHQPSSGEKYLKIISAFFPLSPGRIVFFMVLLLGFAYLIKNLVAMVEVFYQNFSIQKMNIEFKNKLLYRYAKSDYGFYLTRKASLGMQVVNTDIENMFSMGMISLAGIISEIIIFFGLLGIIIFMNPFLALIVFTIASIGSGLVIKVLMPRFYRWGQKSQEAALHNLRNLMQFFQGFKEIILLDKQDSFIRSYQHYSQEKSYFQALQMTGLSLPRMIIELLFIGIFVIAITVLCYEHESPGQMLGILGGYLYAGFRIMPGLNRIINYLNVFKSSIPSIEMVFQEYNMIQTKKALLDLPAFTFKDSLVMKNVFFSYPGISRKILNNISFTLKKGECIGIIGKAGSGKSTLIDLILGLLHPSEGSILIDEQHYVNSYQWHRKIGYVPQSIYLIEDTIEANIVFCKEEVHQQRLEKAIEIAQLKSFVDQLPQKTKTVIGEQGLRLSGGERQRIAIARAFYHQPEVLIFDEATSALDNETEAQLMETIGNVTKNLTVIMVAHRLTTLRACNWIIVMEKGKIGKIISYKELQHPH